MCERLVLHVCEDLKDNGEHMDFSDYRPSHPNYDKTNTKVLGIFKDELNGRITIYTSFMGLKPKSYCYKVDGHRVLSFHVMSCPVVSRRIVLRRVM